MIESLFLVIGLGLGGVVAWWGAKSLLQSQYAFRVKELDTKARYAQGEAAGLKEKISAMQQEVAVLRGSIEEERLSKTETIGRLTQTFKKGVLVMGAAYFLVGMAGGGTVAWLWATSNAEAKKVYQMSRLELTAGLAKVKAELLEKRMAIIEKNLGSLQYELNEERIAKTIAETKLQIFLGSLSRQWGVNGFVVDYDKLKQNLKKETPITKSQPVISLTGTTKAI